MREAQETFGPPSGGVRRPAPNRGTRGVGHGDRAEDAASTVEAIAERGRKGAAMRLLEQIQLEMITIPEACGHSDSRSRVFRIKSEV
jgi:hypothetical protein